MPYDKNGIIYTRITEASSYVECEALAWIDQQYPVFRPRKANAVTLAGTIMHHKIAEDEMKKMVKAYKKIPFELDHQERGLFQGLITDHQKQKQIQKTNSRFKHMSEPELMTKYEKVMENVRIFFGNYQQFCIDNPHTPVFIEEQRFYEPLKIAGTVDLLAKFKLRGYLRTVNLHPKFNVGAKRYFFEDPNGEEMEVTTILDWKSSKTKQKGHTTQLSAYHLMWELTGDLDRLRQRKHIINAQVFSVLFGVREKIPKYVLAQGLPTMYQFLKYDVDTTLFLVCLEIRESPRPITNNLKGKDGIKGRCTFCASVMYCPDNKVIPNSYRSDAIISLTNFTYKDTSSVLLALKELDNPAINPVKQKLQDIHNKLEKNLKIFKNVDLDQVIAHDSEIG